MCWFSQPGAGCVAQWQPPIDTVAEAGAATNPRHDCDSEQCPCCAATVPPGSRLPQPRMGPHREPRLEHAARAGPLLSPPPDAAALPKRARRLHHRPGAPHRRIPWSSNPRPIPTPMDSTPPPTTQESASPIAPTPPRPPSLQMEDRLSTIPSRSAVKERGNTPHTTKAPVATLSLPALPRPVLRASPPSGDRDHRTPAPFQDPLSLPRAGGHRRCSCRWWTAPR